MRLAVASVLFLVGCGSNGSQPEPPAEPPLVLQVAGEGVTMTASGAAVTMREGAPLVLDLAARTRALTAQELSAVQWTSSNQEAATVQGGQIVALAPGDTQITGTLGGASITIATTVESALFGEWVDSSGQVVRRIQAGPNNTIEILRTSRNENLIMNGQPRVFQRDLCRRCLLDGVYPLSSPYGTFRRTGPGAWEYRYMSADVACGGFAGCQRHETQIVAAASLDATGNTLTIGRAGDASPSTWSRVVPAPAPTAAEQAALNAQAEAAQAEARAAREAAGRAP